MPDRLSVEFLPAFHEFHLPVITVKHAAYSVVGCCAVVCVAEEETCLQHIEAVIPADAMLPRPAVFGVGFKQVESEVISVERVFGRFAVEMALVRADEILHCL